MRKSQIRRFNRISWRTYAAWVGVALLVSACAGHSGPNDASSQSDLPPLPEGYKDLGIHMLARGASADTFQRVVVRPFDAATGETQLARRMTPSPSSQPLSTIEGSGGVGTVRVDSENMTEAAGWVLLYGASVECGIGGMPLDDSISPSEIIGTDRPVVPPYGYVTGSSGKRARFVFARDATTCEEHLAQIEAMLCMASKLAQLANTEQPLVWGAKAQALDFEAGSIRIPFPWVLPPQSEKDRFVARDLALYTLASMGAHVLADPVNPGLGRNNCQSAVTSLGYGERIGSPMIPGALGPVGPRGYYYGPKAAITNDADLAKAGETRSRIWIQTIRAASELVHQLVSEGVDSDLAAAEEKRTLAGDPKSGNLLAHGLGDDRTSLYGSKAHALRLLAGRWEMGWKEGDTGPMRNPACVAGMGPLDLYAGPPVAVSPAVYQFEEANGEKITPRTRDGMVPSIFLESASEALRWTRPKSPIDEVAARVIDATNFVSTRQVFAAEGAGGTAFMSDFRSAVKQRLHEVAGSGQGGVQFFSSNSTSPTTVTAAINKLVDEIPDSALSSAMLSKIKEFNFVTGTKPTESRPVLDVIKDLGLEVIGNTQTPPSSTLPFIPVKKFPSFGDLPLEAWARATRAQVGSQCTDIEIPPVELGGGGGGVTFQNSYGTIAALNEIILRIANRTPVPWIQEIAQAGLKEGGAIVPGWLNMEYVAANSTFGSNPMLEVTDYSQWQRSEATNEGRAGAGLPELSLFYGTPRQAECVAEKGIAACKLPETSIIRCGDNRSCRLAPDLFRLSLPSTFPALFADDKALLNSAFQVYLIATKGIPQYDSNGKGVVLGAIRWSAPLRAGALNLVYSPHQQKLYSSIFGSTGALKPNPASWSKYAGVTARRDYVPLENAVIGGGIPNAESSWKHYFQVAKEAADRSDRLAQEVIALRDRKANATQAAQEELGRICGDYATLQDVKWDKINGKPIVPASNKTVAACIDDKKTDIAFLGQDLKDLLYKHYKENPAERVNGKTWDEFLETEVLRCNTEAGASNPLCVRAHCNTSAGSTEPQCARPENKVPISTRGIGILDANFENASSTVCDGLNDLANKYASGALSYWDIDGYKDAAWATTTGIQRALSRVKLKQNPDGTWELRAGDRVILSSSTDFRQPGWVRLFGTGNNFEMFWRVQGALNALGFATGQVPDRMISFYLPVSTESGEKSVLVRYRMRPEFTSKLVDKPAGIAFPNGGGMNGDVPPRHVQEAWAQSNKMILTESPGLGADVYDVRLKPLGNKIPCHYNIGSTEYSDMEDIIERGRGLAGWILDHKAWMLDTHLEAVPLDCKIGAPARPWSLNACPPMETGGYRFGGVRGDPREFLDTGAHRVQATPRRGGNMRTQVNLTNHYDRLILRENRWELECDTCVYEDKWVYWTPNSRMPLVIYDENDNPNDVSFVAKARDLQWLTDDVNRFRAPVRGIDDAHLWPHLSVDEMGETMPGGMKGDYFARLAVSTTTAAKMNEEPWNGTVEANTLVGWLPVYLDPGITSPLDRAPAFMNIYPHVEPEMYSCGGFNTLLRSLALACNLSSLGADRIEPPQTIANAGDLVETGHWVRRMSRDLSQNAAFMHVQYMPDRIVDEFSGSTPPSGTLQGQKGAAVLRLGTAIRGVSSSWGQLTQILDGIGSAMETTGLELAIIEKSADAEQIRIAIQESQIHGALVTAAIGAAGSAVSGVLNFRDKGRMVSDFTSSMSQVASMPYLEDQLKYLEKARMAGKELSEYQATKVLKETNARVAQDFSNLIVALNTLRSSVSEAVLIGQELKDMEERAVFEIARGRGSEFITEGTGPTATRIPLPVNAVLDNQLDLATRRYRTAEREAKHLAYLARLAVEQRIGMHLEDMKESVGGVDAPSTWVDSLGNSGGVDTHKLDNNPAFLSKMATALTVNGAPLTADKNFTDELLRHARPFVGDYVATLEAFMTAYSVAYPFQSGDDIAVLSMRSDILASDVMCMQESKNMLLHSDDMTTWSVKDNKRQGWALKPCNAAGKCLAAVRAQNSPMTILREFKSRQTSTGTDAGAPDGGGSGDAGSNAPLDQAAWDSTPSATVSQRVYMPEQGWYLLSWWDQAASIDSRSPLVEADYEVRVFTDKLSLVDMQKERSYMPPTVNDAGVLVGSAYGPRRSMAFFVTQPGYYQVAFSASTSSNTSLSAVGIFRPQLEKVDYQASDPSAYEETKGSRMQMMTGCDKMSPEDFRDQFDYKCEKGKCYHELRKPFYLDTVPLTSSARSPLDGKVAAGNFNYRHEALAFNIVGVGTKDCTEAPESCNGQAYTEFDLRHLAGSVPIVAWDGKARDFNFGIATVNHGKCLASERVVGTPMNSADQAFITQTGLEKRDFAGRPLDGGYALRVYDMPGFDWARVRDIQVIMRYKYWSKTTK